MCYGACPVYWEIFSSFPGLYPLDASSTPPFTHDGKKYLLGPKFPWLRPTILEGNSYSINYFLSTDCGKCHLSLHVLHHLPKRGSPFLLA